MIQQAQLSNTAEWKQHDEERHDCIKLWQR